MKSVMFVVNLLALAVTGLLLLSGVVANEETLLWGMSFLFLLGVLQIICAVVLVFLWSRLAAPVRRVLRFYLVTTGAYGLVTAGIFALDLGDLGRWMRNQDWLGIFWMGVVPFLLATYFTRVCYMYTRHDHEKKVWESDILDQGL
jgi:hypothetical protein